MKINKKIFAIIALVVIFVISATATLLIMKDKPQTDEASASVVETTTEEVTEETTPEETEAGTTTKAPQYKETNEVVYATANVNIRTGPSKSDAVISVLMKGESIQRTAIGDNDWSKVIYEGKPAYVSSKYLSTVVPGGNIKVDMCGISNTDMKNLTDTLEYIFFYGTSASSYNCKSEDAFEKAMGAIYGAPFSTFSEAVSEIYRIRYEHDLCYNSNQPDPKGYWQQYRQEDAEFIDFILEEIFNVEPNHDYILSEDWDGEKHMKAYYQNGIYYSDAMDGGDGVGPDVQLKKVEVLPDGKYKITVHDRVVTGDENGNMITFMDGDDYTIITEMKNVNGTTVWSYYEIKPV